MDTSSPKLNDLKAVSKSQPVIPVIVLNFVLLAIAIWLLSITFLKQREARQCLTWPSVKGIVIDHQIKEHTHREQSGYSKSYITHYVPVISYKYEVTGENYSSMRITLETIEFKTAKEADQNLAKYPIGRRLTVYYNPKNPERAIVDRTIPYPIVSYWLGGGTLFFSLLLLLAMFFVIPKAYLAQGQPGAWKHSAFWKELRSG